MDGVYVECTLAYYLEYATFSVYLAFVNDNFAQTLNWLTGC